MELKLIRLPEVINRTGLSRSSIYQLMRTGDFPENIKLSQRSVAWESRAIDEWIHLKISGKN